MPLIADKGLQYMVMSLYISYNPSRIFPYAVALSGYCSEDFQKERGQVKPVSTCERCDRYTLASMIFALRKDYVMRALGKKVECISTFFPSARSLCQIAPIDFFSFDQQRESFARRRVIAALASGDRPSFRHPGVDTQNC